MLSPAGAGNAGAGGVGAANTGMAGAGAFPFQPDFTWHRIMLKVTHLEDAK